MDIESDQLLEPDLTLHDFLKAVGSSRPTVNKADIEEHVKFTNDFGKISAGVERVFFLGFFVFLLLRQRSQLF